MPLSTLLDLPVKEKLPSDTPDLTTDHDFELDLRVIATSSKDPSMIENTSSSWYSYCEVGCQTNTCDSCGLFTCGPNTCFDTCYC